MKLSRYEQETIVSYNAGEQTATIYTRDKAVMRKLDTLVANFPDTYKLVKQDEVSKTIPSRNHSSATASPGRSVWSRENKQEKKLD